MERTKARRRRVALSVLADLAIASFVLGAALGGGSGSGGRPPARAGERGRSTVRQADQRTTAGAEAGERSTARGEADQRSTAPGGAGGKEGSARPGGTGREGSMAGGEGAEEASAAALAGALRPGELAETLRPGELAGERVVVGIDGTGITRELRAAIATGRVAGVVLFEADFPTRAAGRALVRSLQEIPRPSRLAGLPLLVMTDQEGGEVARVSGAPEASAAAMGAEGPAYARRQGRLTAANLKSLGVTVDLAPVLDVGRPGGVIAGTERAFADTAAGVARTAVPFAEGLEEGGVAATAKHFPGFGAAVENTDFESQTIGLTRATLRQVDIAPYRSYVASGARLVMVSTAIYPALSPRPAAFSRRIVTGELRRRLGFRGVTITDSLGGAAVAAFGGQREAAVDGAAAGDDLLLFDDLPSALAGHEALVAQLRKGGLRRAPFLTAVARVVRLRAALR